MPRELFLHASLNARFSSPNRSSDGREGECGVTKSCTACNRWLQALNQSRRRLAEERGERMDTTASSSELESIYDGTIVLDGQITQIGRMPYAPTRAPWPPPSAGAAR